MQFKATNTTPLLSSKIRLPYKTVDNIADFFHLKT